MKQSNRVYGQEEIMRRELTSDEAFLLSFLEGFDRKIAKDWEQNQFWDFHIKLED